MTEASDDRPAPDVDSAAPEAADTGASSAAPADAATTDGVPASSDAVTDDAVADGPRPEHADIADLSYESARDELVSIVSRLEAGRTDLEESMALWERGEALAAHCSRWLDGAQQRLERRVDES